MPEILPFTKMQGVGNDFVVIDGRLASDLDWSVLAQEICDRHTGVGADGLLVVETTHLADILMRMYNPDGTPDVCGNGLRCVSRYARERGLVVSDHFRVATLAGPRESRIFRDAAGAFQGATINMGLPRLDPSSIPMLVALDRVVDYGLDLNMGDSLSFSALSTGSTHAVTFVSALPDDATFHKISPQVEEHPIFPERTSLIWCVVELPTHLRIRIWERGAGETWGCGTGACAAAVASVLRGQSPAGEPITVSSVGGDLVIRWSPGEPMEMSGPAETIYEGRYPLEPAHTSA